MKYAPILIIIFWPLFSWSQIPIVGIVRPLKDIDDNIEVFEIVLTLNNDTLLFKEYTRESIGKPGQYPAELFKVYYLPQHGQLKCSIRYGKAGYMSGGTTKFHEVKVSGRELRIEIEYYFQEYESGTEYLSEFTFKKIYKLPEALLLIPVWDYKIESNPRYIISNSSGYLLYGQSNEGYCEGMLFKEAENGKYERYYTGGHNTSRNAERPLYNESELVSTIRDSRRSDKFLITEPGKYLYTVRLGFEPYELSTGFGIKPWYSADRVMNPDSECYMYIKEYFELSEEFQIKQP